MWIIGRTGPIWFSMGFGFGLATEQGNAALQSFNERIRQNAIEAVKNRPIIDTSDFPHIKFPQDHNEKKP